jgi:formylglycine-generating enzyme required for sulfatase activity
MTVPLFFISYVRTQRNLMDAYIRAALDELGLSYWYDGELNTAPVTDWWQQTAKYIADCEFFTFLLTEEWQNSAECQREYNTALAHTKEIFPVAPFDFDYAAEFAYFKRSHQISFVFEKEGRASLRARFDAAGRAYLGMLQSQEGKVEEQSELRDALQGIVKENESIRILGRGKDKKLSDIFLPLRLGRFGEPHSEPIGLLDLISPEQSNRLILSGGPGGGKSTLLQYLQVLSAQSEFPWLSARVTFRGLASKKLPFESWIDGYTLGHFGMSIKDLGATKPDAPYRLLVLLDGLDEISSDDYSKLSHEVVRFSDMYPAVKLILTSRPNGFEPSDFDGYSHLTVMPLTDNDVREYIRGTLDEADADRLLEVIESSDRLTELVETPFVLALLTISHIDVARNARERASLFRSAVNYLLKGEDWDKSRPPVSSREVEYQLRILKRIALRLFMLESNGIFERSEVLQCISLERDPLYSPDVTLDALVRNSGLLQFDKDGYYFVHRSIWEYLVAAACRDETLETIAERSTARRWEEPVRLYVGLTPDGQVDEVIRAIWDQNASLALRAMTERREIPGELLAEIYGQCSIQQKLRILHDVDRLRASALSRREFQRILVDTARVISEIEFDCEVLYVLILLLNKFSSKDATALCGKILRQSELDDRLNKYFSNQDYHFAFSNIDAGNFDMGIDFAIDGEPADASEKPRHPVSVDDYYAGTYLVTNKLYYDAFPYATDRRNEYSQEDAQPVNKVSWYEAILFAWWLGCDLPTDAEWEYMARGIAVDHEDLNNLSKLPDYAWHGANSNNQTHAVGTKLPNSRGLFDLAGNLREWCNDWYDETYYKDCLAAGRVHNPTGPDAGERRVLRGGTFDWAVWNLRPTYRNSNTPDNRNHVTGFRIIARAGSKAYSWLTEGDI